METRYITVIIHHNTPQKPQKRFRTQLQFLNTAADVAAEVLALAVVVVALGVWYIIGC